MKSEVQEQIKEGCGLGWESYKLEGFVQKFSDTIFNFQEKVDDVLSYTDKIDGFVCSMETCEYKTKTFRVILEQIQKLIDDLNLRSYSNLSAWVKHLDHKVTMCTLFTMPTHLTRSQTPPKPFPHHVSFVEKKMDTMSEFSLIANISHR